MFALPIIFASTVLGAAVNADFMLMPSVNEAVIGESTYFECTTTTTTNEVHWHHYKVGAKDNEDICLYCMGKVHPIYDNRIEVQQNISTNSRNSRLRIQSVLSEDAGRYICRDNGEIGDSLVAHLVVLVHDPFCQTNFDTDVVLGPNSCDMDPDVLKMSCGVFYHGEISPKIQWREALSADPIETGVICRHTANEMTCDLAINASLDLQGSSFVCETTNSPARRYNCTSGVINVIHANTNDAVTEIILGTKETVNCSAYTSQSCKYTWKWIDGIKEEVVSNDAVLKLSKPGWHMCEAECELRDIECTVISGFVLVTEQTMKNE